MSLLIFVGFFYFINSSLCISLENPHSDKFYYEKRKKKEKIMKNYELTIFIELEIFVIFLI